MCRKRRISLPDSEDSEEEVQPSVDDLVDLPDHKDDIVEGIDDSGKVGEQKGSTIRHSKPIDESDNTENKEENVEPDSDEEIFTPNRKREKSRLIESDVEDTCDDNNGSLEDKGEVKANVEHESESEGQEDSGEEIFTPKQKRKKSCLIESDVEDTCDDNNGSLEDKGEVKANVELESESEDQEEIITPKRKRNKSSIVESDSEDDADETNMSESIAKIENSPNKEDATIEIVCKTEPGKELENRNFDESEADLTVESNIKVEPVEPTLLENVKIENIKTEDIKHQTETLKEQTYEQSNSQGSFVDNSDDNQSGSVLSSNESDTGDSSDSDESESDESDNVDTGRVRVQKLKKKLEKEKLFDKFRKERQRKLQKQSIS